MYITNCNVSVMGGAITANDSCDKKLVLYNPAGASPTETYSGVSCGASYSWTVDQGSDKAEITAGANTITCTVRAKAASAAVNDVRLRLTYTRGGASCYSYMYTTVQKPTSLTRSAFVYEWQQCQPVTNKVDMQGHYTDTVYDQFGQTVAHAYWAENWAGGFACIQNQRNAFTGCAGTVTDTWSRLPPNSTTCTVNRVLICGDTQTVTVSGWGCKLRYSRADYSGPSPTPTMDGADIGCPP